ncbi:MAG: Ppx/GppA family phosphatase, partial [Pseudomonadota bacterium]
DTGLEIEIIAAEEEARLAVAGCAPLFDPAAEHLLVFDIGGGSTELIWVDLASTSPEKRVAVLKALALGQGSARARDAARHVNDWISLPVGVVTLIESYSGHDDDREQFDAMHAHVAELIRPFAERAGCAPTAERLEKLQVLGTSGTITTLAGVHLELQRYSRDRVDGVWIGGAEVDEVISRLREMTPYERAAVPCIGDDRATNLMSGAAILRAILRAWPTDRLRVADRGLREGLLYGLMQDAQRRAPRGAGR